MEVVAVAPGKRALHKLPGETVVVATALPMWALCLLQPEQPIQAVVAVEAKHRARVLPEATVARGL